MALQQIRAELDSLATLVARTEKSWADPAEMEAALRFQAALAAAREARPWTDEGLSVIEDGRCGTEMKADLLRMREMRALQREIEALADVGDRTAGLWTGLHTDVAEVEAALSFHAGVTSAISLLAGSVEELAAVKGALELLLGDGNAVLAHDSAVGQGARTCLDAVERFHTAVEAFRSACSQTPEAFAAIANDDAAALADTCRAVAAMTAKLNSWCAWRKARAAALAAGLAPLVQAIESGWVEPGSVREAFEVNYARWWLNALVDSDPVLRTFVLAQHENRVQAFKALDDRFIELTRAFIRASLCAELPDRGQIAKNSGWGLLNKEMQKKRAHIPLRALVRGMGDALPKLAPCLLMSPLSIAQYLPSDQAMFDIVVFDEASQIPVWDAIGAIARGRQVVMVGDPRQLPPTNFFGRSEEEADDDVELEGDMESILDECIGANLPVLTLDWHYRSPHESLIAFSNHRYYDGRLVTFPSPVTDDRAVSFHLVSDGVYEKGGGRTNKPEAAALVRHLVGRLKDPEFAASGLTIGVVTFNSEQQKLIEDMLDAERRKDPALERFFAEDAPEPVFVKNLENVQGDERDVMYFSITYGPDRTGAVSMNFGPMNKSGGERRLNVAITRARHALHVFSSLTPDRIDLSRTKAEGVRDLKHFLEFAERGPRALAEVNMGSIGEYESPFEQAVAAALAERGWRVHPQIGVSRFRIDLGVVDPDAPGRYLAGIECDGATYHRAATARDRDKLREQLLRGLGWEIIRIWSTDWWMDRSGALDRVHDRLTALLESARARRTAEEEAQAEAAPSADPDEPVQEADSPAMAGSSPESEVSEPARIPQIYFESLPATAPQPTGVYASGLAEAVSTYAAAPVFQEWDPATADGADGNAFFEASYDETLLSIISSVVAAEGPVRDDVLARRIARAHGWSRTGGRIHNRVLTLAKRRFVLEKDGEHWFVWPADADTRTFPTYRRPAPGAWRPVEETALPELVALAREIRTPGMDADAAVKAMSRAAGFQKLRQTSRDRLEMAWRMA